MVKNYKNVPQTVDLKLLKKFLDKVNVQHFLLLKPIQC
jgi:hypothetical protein